MSRLSQRKDGQLKTTGPRGKVLDIYVKQLQYIMRELLHDPNEQRPKLGKGKPLFFFCILPRSNIFPYAKTDLCFHSSDTTCLFEIERCQDKKARHEE